MRSSERKEGGTVLVQGFEETEYIVGIKWMNHVRNKSCFEVEERHLRESH